jgi:AcrR family transcriptional regulator
MARPKAFDPVHIASLIASEFRVSGYAGTSLAALELATGIGRQSLYDTFGDKDAMYARAVSDEVRAEEARVGRLFDGAAGGLATLRAYLAERASRLSSDRGCLLSSAALEAGRNVQLNAELRASLWALQTRILGAAATVLSMASRRGEVRSTTPVPTFARTVVALWAGMPVRLGAGATESDLLADVDALLAVIRAR